MTIDGTPVVDPVTGEPAISGTAQVGYTLTADTSAITGIAMPGEFSYQWIVVDGGTETDIDGATSSTYTLTSADAGKQIKVRVSFADDAGENQQVTSAATPAVAAADATITIAADAEKATGKIDWVHYTLSRDGNTASAVTVPVTFEGFAGNDWNLDAARRAHQAKFEVGNATATLSVRLGTGVRSLGFSNTATLSRTLTARLGVWRRADDVRRVMGTCATASCGYVCSTQPQRCSDPRRLWVILTRYCQIKAYCRIKAAVLWFVACSYALLAVDRQNPGIRCARRHEGSYDE